MSRKQDPIVHVLRYFESSDLAQAEQGLAIAREIVRKRQPRPVAKKTVKKVTPKPKPPAGAVSVKGDAAQAPPASTLPSAVEQTKARRRKAVAGALSTPSVRKEEDLALPGLGPATVGE